MAHSFSADKALFMGLDTLAPLDATRHAQCVFLRARPASEIFVQSPVHTWLLEQSFAPHALALQDVGFAVSPYYDVPAHSVDRVLYLATRFPEENLAMLARGWHMLKTGGVLLAALHNDLGAKRLETAMKQLVGGFSSLSKYHCRVIALKKPEGAEESGLLREWLNGVKPVNVSGTPLQASPGMFSWRAVDEGSQLLAESLPASLQGHGADIGAGWGYLSWSLLEKSPSIRHITLFEAEKRALDMAEKNLNAHTSRCSFVWADATRPLPSTQPFDWAIMNPPAHDLEQSAPDVSAAILTSTARSLKPGGWLRLVANRHLPYERTLQNSFSSVRMIKETGKYKILEALR